MKDVKVRIRRGSEERQITRRKAPAVGSTVNCEGKKGWRVLSVEYPVKYRTRVEGFTAPRGQAA